jgi:hypothetical protein
VPSAAISYPGVIVDIVPYLLHIFLILGTMVRHMLDMRLGAADFLQSWRILF